MRQMMPKGLLGLGLGLLPGLALACALPPSIVMTLPTTYYIWGAALTVALTVPLAARRGRPMPSPSLAPAMPPTWTFATSYLGFLVFLGLIGIGFLGPRDPMHNLLTLVFWTLIWVLLPLLCLACGNLWAGLNPWSGPIKMTRALLGREKSVGLTRLGHWPAVLGFFGFSWFQIVSLSPDDPLVLAQLALGYWVVIFLLGVLEGEDWIWQGEFFCLYVLLLSRLAPIWREAGHLKVGWPGAQLLRHPALDASGTAFVLLLLSALSFDGLRDTFWWLDRIGQNPLEFGGRSAVVGENTFGLLAAWALTTALVLGALALGRKMTGATLPTGPVMLSFLAIAAGYHGAHYLLMLLTAGQYLLSALNDPFFRGDAFLGLPPFYVSYGLLTDRGTMVLIWNLQFALILGAHMLAITLAHRLSPSARALLPLDALMVLYTIFGLWMLSSPTGT